jgi:DNA-binding transcriptional LysR family regulator
MGPGREGVVDGLRRLEVLICVADASSFSAAARKLGLAQSQVSRAVRELEDDVGAALFVRSTRRVVVTAEGAAYLRGARQALDVLRDTASVARAGAGAVTGPLRVTAPPAFGRLLAPVVADLIVRHPALEIDAVLTDRVVDLVEEGIDVAVRFGALEPSALRAKKLGLSASVVCASPRYLAGHPLPRAPADLAAHEHVLLSGKARGGPLVLTDARGRTARVSLQGRLRTNDLAVARDAAISGAGIATLPRALVAAAVERGELVELLRGWAPRPTPIHAVYVPRSPPAARVVAFVTAIAAALADPGRPPRRSR